METISSKSSHDIIGPPGHIVRCGDDIVIIVTRYDQSTITTSYDVDTISSQSSHDIIRCPFRHRTMWGRYRQSRHTMSTDANGDIVRCGDDIVKVVTRCQEELRCRSSDDFDDVATISSSRRSGRPSPPGQASPGWSN